MMLRNIGKQRILHVDLLEGKTWIEDVPQADLVKYLGGRGLAAKWLYERVPAGIDPLGPENILIFSTGTLTGTSAPSSGRSSITTKSPTTGLYLKVSVGGHLGAMLKFAGYDYVMIHGQSPKPVYLWVADGGPW
jgi:aldehyde:ferredoxin oxidoreductase